MYEMQQGQASNLPLQDKIIPIEVLKKTKATTTFFCCMQSVSLPYLAKLVCQP
jgi:plastocyanin domain-containing protein